MIPIGDRQLYQRSLGALSDFSGPGYRGRLVQILLAAKYHGPSFPRIGQGAGISIGDLQHLLDAFYWKSNPPQADHNVAIIFEDNHLVPTGRVAGGLRVGSNIWRNPLSLQKASICFATERELTDQAFLDAPRVQCPHLRPEQRGSLRGARCALNDGPSYRGEEGPKGVRKDPLDDGYSVIPPENTAFWRSIVRRGGLAIPVIPLIVALYHDNALASGRTEVDVADFARDFGFSRQEFDAYFDDDHRRGVNAQLADAFPELSWTRYHREEQPAVGAVREIGRPFNHRRARAPVDLDTLPDAAPRTEPPAGSHWWSAEQAVKAYLEASNWIVKDRSRQPVGFDLEAARAGGPAMYVEVKSSVGACSPVLTQNEFNAAVRHGNHYVLAIVERYDPAGPASVLWVRNPAALNPRAVSVTQFALPRSVWLRGASATL